MSDDKKSKLYIRLHVYDSEIGVTIDRADEVYYRNAAKLITDTINSYASAFRGRKTEKDVLYMSLIDIALHYEQLADHNDAAPYEAAMQSLTKEIEEAMK